MNVEAVLTRTFDITFIDARTIANEAKMNLGIQGYPSKRQQKLLVNEAINIFERYPDEVRNNMQIQKASLDSMKINTGALSYASSVSDMDNTEGSGASTSSMHSFAKRRRSSLGFGRR